MIRVFIRLIVKVTNYFRFQQWNFQYSYLILHDEGDAERRHDGEHVADAVRDAHQRARVVRRQVDVRDLGMVYLDDFIGISM